ncbi:Blp family class II bacteriocin [Streptococcus saliviloxodontae]|uniref:Membrane protein n=1 Tax=Streptococcus saliviloxodontae TaxID=1349416 RepID=A0ABS2PKK7_9STRE|nr:Blp family class II bacteriocin [Streptococcus saliviloxodontae]MBM7635545.1 putative membrane protein [Streptococcus saliviloxodontae]
MEQFNVLNADTLATVEGGVSTVCVATIAGGAAWGGSRGLAGGLVGGAIGTAVGAAAGAIIGCR